MSHQTTDPAPTTADGVELSAEGYAKALSSRQVTMIAIGGAIGVGLFMGAGGRLASTGPALIFSYAIAGLLGFFLMRAMGELIMYRRTSGSFVSYTGEFFGAKGAYVSGWAYVLNWAMTGVAELIAIGLYVSHLLPSIPWILSAIIALVLLTSVNMISVKIFGEFEFWASVFKVFAIVAFLLIGTILVIMRTNIAGHEAGFHNLTAVGGSMFPSGFFPMILVLSGVVFAYNGIEMIGITAGEMQNAEKEVPKAIRAVVVRILVFYVGSVTLLALLLPSDVYQSGVSPFVTVFSQLGWGWVGTLMTLVVVTAALSSCNSGLYSIGRVFRQMAHNGHAPQWLTKMNSRHVPYASILAIAGFYLVGIVAAYLITGGKGSGNVAFDLALETAAVGVLLSWAAIFASQIALRKRHGNVSKLPMPGGIVASWISIAAIAGILILIGFNTQELEDGSTFPMGLLTVASLPVFLILLAIGWPLVKRTNPERQEQAWYDKQAVVEHETVANIANH
ncbi:amino acid permease [Falsarthrobacter nasiphocae]|uniref:L-asparagine permease n=1 Tax=Falsarthrobacter nasiphocae TaxID=189863 RepID=A0AAE3YGN8_9MICC|nr:amino acid permease [Falsarthrobacter nasiphocae]MDR6892382.1 L-asparagine permease [Falsarthrobacter nasiphocae]